MNKNTEAMSEKDVHTEHCCRIHGCKYNDSGCSVANKTKIQSFECEDCTDSRTIVYALDLQYDNEGSSILSVHITHEGASMAAEKYLNETKAVNQSYIKKQDGDSTIFEFNFKRLVIYPIKVEP